MTEKFIVELPAFSSYQGWPKYFQNFVDHCNYIARHSGQLAETVLNHELKPLGGQLIKTSTMRWHMCWDHPKHHTLFVLRWS
jgi:hypothetical protein